MTTDQINEMREINLALIKQNQEIIPSSDQWENESKNAKINYAAGYKAALEFCNNQLKCIEQRRPLHHLEQLQDQIRINRMKESGEYVLDAEYWNEPY